MSPIKHGLTIITALLMLNACGSSPPSNSLSSEEASAIGESVAIETEDAVSELVIDDALNSLGLAASKYLRVETYASEISSHFSTFVPHKLYLSA
jgi:hypothetical protein